MKKKNIHTGRRIFSFYILLLISVIIVSCEKQTILPRNATINFHKPLHDFGALPLNKEASFVFEFMNNGKELLQIQDVQTTCGCAVPVWTKEVIKPTGAGAIKVTYDSEYPGRFNKTITVYYNGENSPMELKIKGQVAYPEDKKE